MWGVRLKNRYKNEAVHPDKTREVAELRRQTHGRAKEPPERDLSREAAEVMVVGPPGCCGCVSTSVSSVSRRKH